MREMQIQPLCKLIWKFLNKLKKLQCDPSISTHRYKEIKIDFENDRWLSMFLAALLAIAKVELSKCPSMGKQTK